MIDIRKNEDGSLDEIACDACVVHLEQLDTKHWWMAITDVDGRTIHVEFTGVKSASVTYDDAKPRDKVPADLEYRPARDHWT